MLQKRLGAFVLVIAAALVGYFVYTTQIPNKPSTTSTSTPAIAARCAFKRGLDLAGGSHLVYRADTSKLAAADIGPSMTALRDVIERRVNLFGVSEPLVQVES